MATLTLICGLTCASAVGTDPTKRDDTQNMKGIWKISKIWKNGKPVPPDSPRTKFIWIIDSRQIAIERAKGTIEEILTYHLDPSKSPPTINLRDPQHPGKVTKGIYTFQGSKLQIAWSTRGGPRPSRISLPPASSLTLVSLERIR